ncbi:ABC transporter substrate-binding protein [Clavibacter michiganensis subsp. phaseoli]|uniref:ABC transporter substrate-binding protein n=1 Tax=Clavibacter phaseoli TaxID=1734031 RepID=A0A8I0S8N5_9MICO|nr:ABC transporter substrate-binding protein [Clavibacter phaseoli]MBF4631567.1 ABC transporter substrate-binding protein [Clavibacter phaseoli]
MKLRRPSTRSPRASALRRTLVAGTAIATAVALSACSGGSVTGNVDDATGRTTITMWNQATGDAATKLTELVQRFNDAQDQYTVQSQFIASEGFTARMVQALSSDQAPNLVISDSEPSSLGESIATGKIVPLDDKLGTGDYALSADDIPEGMLASGQFDGTTYALPTDGGDYAIIYNKEMFAEAGITDTPTTWDELAADAKTLTKDGRYGVYLPIGSNEWPVFTFQSMLWSAGGEFLNEDDSEVAFDSPEGVKALTTWTDMVKDGVAYPSSAADSNQNQGAPFFNAGQFAMFIGGAYNLSTVQEGIGAENVGVFTFPQIDQPAMNTGTNVSYITKGTPEQEAGSYAFLSWFMQPDQQAEWDIASGYLPTNTKTEASDTYSAYLEENPLIQVFVDQLDYARSRPSVSNYAEVSAALGAELEKAMLLKESPEDALKAAAAAGQAALDAG